ncbi:hypothetical protein [Candidatus Nitrosocosmicus arcticus]|uniref:Uncharacterized protein n=1 Tax=Candidatus Nitrosocosmicus arcticus TaxID=2035267 RepID=A0A557SQW5_9ARCH|nr:hypothetical protein [Candidatus Nitrosocosmicus arcticus]TVP39000.1 hypothetical protein NARC_240004 [Candidatus Nitrosocosmicus arcticus]
MDSFLRPPLDFTVSREDWCRYDLSDDSILKIKLIAAKIRKKNADYSIDIQNIIVVLSNERGQPDSKAYTPPELQQSITQDVRYTTISQDWNEYVVDDGANIKVQPMVTKVSKTSKFDLHGDPIYLVNVQGNVVVEKPKSLSQ